MNVTRLDAQPAQPGIQPEPPRAAQAIPQTPPDFTWDFESGDLRGWERTGGAFEFQPTFGDNPTARNRGQPSNHQGDHWIGTFERYQSRSGQRPGAVQGDEPTGTLTSPEFTIPGGRLSFLVGGGRGPNTRVELLVEDQIEAVTITPLRATGRNSETMRRVTWDLDPWRGWSARLRIVDEASGGWGHINVDDFRFSAWMTEVPDLRGRRPPEAESLLPQFRLRLGEVLPVTSDRPPGLIVGQSPEPDVRVRFGTPVAIRVAEPGQVQTITVPDLRGVPEGEVGAVLAEVGLELESVERRPAMAPQRTVIDQSPEPGTQVFPGDLVIVVVADPELVEVPNVRRGELSEARDRIREARLRVSERAAAAPANATVTGQDPPPGTPAPLGAVVDLELTVPVPPEDETESRWWAWLWPYGLIPLVALGALGLAVKLKRKPPRPRLGSDLRASVIPGPRASGIESVADLIGFEVRLRVGAGPPWSCHLDGLSINREERQEG